LGNYFQVKGYSIQAIFPADVPSDWISPHPGLSNGTVKFLQKRNNESIAVFAQYDHILGFSLDFFKSSLEYPNIPYF
jgi:hypothetical protein